MIKQIKKLIFGGHFSYYITKDKKYFIKICWDKEWIQKEFMNLKKYWNQLKIPNLKLAEPVKYSLDKDYLITKFVNGKRLIQLSDPKMYYHFGKLLKEFHKKGFTHSHLEVNDILYLDGDFTLVDVPFFNEKTFIHDLATIGISLKSYRLKKPWNWYIYNRCYQEFLRGYHIENLSEFKKEYNTSFTNRMKYMMTTGLKNKIKTVIMRFFFKIRFY